MSLARDLAYAVDPALWVQDRLGVIPDPWQADVLRSTAPRMLLNCCRQSGKSSVAAWLALHTALYRERALVLLLSPSLRQSGELFRKVIEAYRALGDAAPPEAESALRIELKNGSRIVSLPGSEQTVRGYSGVNLLVCDEASRIEDDLYHSVTPMLAVSRGRLLALSTPFGARGWWYDAWHSDGWERVRITAEQCPRIPREFLERERRGMPDWAFRQEYLGEFADGAGQMFSSELIRQALSADVRPLFGV